MKNKAYKRRLSLQTTIILIVISSTIVSLAASMWLIRQFVVSQEFDHSRDKIAAIAKIAASNARIISALENKELSDAIQTVTLNMKQDTNVDFVVVVNHDKLRLSHPDSRAIGKPFSNPNDIQLALDGTSHYSVKDGILGNGIRYFEPVKNSQGKIIGVVCVGLTMDTITSDIKHAQNTIFIGILLGLSAGVAGAVFLAKKIKKELFGLEPIEIAQSLEEKELVENEITESIIAIDKEHRILLINKEASDLVFKINSRYVLQIKDILPRVLFDILFSKVFTERQRLINQTIAIDNFDLVANISPIYTDGSFTGAVITFRDQSEMTQLIHQLSGTEQYIHSLRAQTHEFMNKMQVIMGMVELKQYDEVSKFIQQFNTGFRAEVGYITDKIKTPAIAGFLLGKANEAAEQDIVFVLANKSNLPVLRVDENIHFLLQILGNLISNAFDAVQQSAEKVVTLSIMYDEEGNIVMITVTDTGYGISRELKDKIFEKNFSTKDKERGYGLYLVNKAVKAREGMIEVTTIESNRTQFYIEFPMIKGDDS